MTGARSRLVIFSPMPPSMNGIADYTAALLSHFEQWYDCWCVVADDAPDPLLVGRWQAMTLSEYRHHFDRWRNERHLFQIGNNTGHAYMLPWLEQVAGVVVQHDAAMPHMLGALAEMRSGHQGFLEILNAAHGRHGGQIAADAMRNGLWIGSVTQEFDCLPLVAARARMMIVHSRLAALRLKAAAPGVAVVVIPHFAQSRALGIGRQPAVETEDQSIMLLCMGFASRAKRIDLTLGAMALLRAQGHDVRLTIAGQVRAEEDDIEAQVAALGLESWVTITGYVAEEDIDRHLESADIVINLRDPTAGESSGTVGRAMAAGCCVVVTDVGAFAEMAEGTVIKVPRPQMRADCLAAILAPYVCSAERRAQLGRQAAAHADHHETMEIVAARYRTAIEAAYAAPSPALPSALAEVAFHVRQAMLFIEARAAEAGPAFSLWWRETLLPVSTNGGHLEVIGGNGGDKLLANTAFGWTGHKGSGAVGCSALALVDEQSWAAPGECLAYIWDWLDRLPMLQSVTIEVANPDRLPEMLRFAMGNRGMAMARSAEGPDIPLVSEPGLQWVPRAWGASFVPAAPPARGRI
ncbi:glycosyltransferase family 4 protein [Sphingomonas sp. 28-63-12]|uniref:glycosyltransferase family 4 protein n=1 Tax=Sphingomonas sp. 28-63-12 TaxID=1970434 RepID=UPI000BD2EC2C|nr:MAG: hypothetical protein B7Y47_13885 [Sphingomonas sp. 28-63-12]